MHFLTRERVGDSAGALDGIIVLYWLVFWTANGADKFLHETNLGPVIWFGKDRAVQIHGYFSLIDGPLEWVDTVIYSIGIWELGMASVFAACGLFLLLYGAGAPYTVYLARLGFLLSALMLIGFTAFDVMVGDRFEVLEHNIYFALVVLTWYIFGRCPVRPGMKGTSRDRKVDV